MVPKSRGNLVQSARRNLFVKKDVYHAHNVVIANVINMQLEFKFVDDIDKKFFSSFLNKDVSQEEVEGYRRLKSYGLIFRLDKEPIEV
jgi:hypothetical protein